MFRKLYLVIITTIFIVIFATVIFTIWTSPDTESNITDSKIAKFTSEIKSHYDDYRKLNIYSSGNCLFFDYGLKNEPSSIELKEIFDKTYLLLLRDEELQKLLNANGKSSIGLNVNILFKYKNDIYNYQCDGNAPKQFISFIDSYKTWHLEINNVLINTIYK